MDLIWQKLPSQAAQLGVPRLTPESEACHIVTRFEAARGSAIRFAAELQRLKRNTLAAGLEIEGCTKQGQKYM